MNDHIRRDFPLTQDQIYLNSAAVTPAPTPVIEAAHRFLHEKNRVQPMQLRAWLDKADELRPRIADLIGARPHEIAWGQSTDR